MTPIKSAATRIFVPIHVITKFAAQFKQDRALLALRCPGDPQPPMLISLGLSLPFGDFLPLYAALRGFEIAISQIFGYDSSCLEGKPNVALERVKKTIRVLH
jgi:hypothetical protein